MKKVLLALAAIAAVVPSTVSAQWRDGQRYDQRYEFKGYDRNGNPIYAYHDRRYNRYNRDNRWRTQSAYQDYQRNDRRDRRYYREDERCRDGTTGALLGAVAGGLLGRTIDRSGDRTAGTVVGGVGGAVAGRAIDRNCR